MLTDTRTAETLAEGEPLVEDAVPGTWLIQTGKPRGRHVRRAHYFVDGQDRPICGMPDFPRKPSYAAATRPQNDWRFAVADDPTLTHLGSGNRLDRTVCGNCLHELRVTAGAEQPRTHRA